MNEPICETCFDNGCITDEHHKTVDCPDCPPMTEEEKTEAFLDEMANIDLKMIGYMQ